MRVPGAGAGREHGRGVYTATTCDIFPLIGPTRAFATFGQRWLGDPAGIDLDDTLFGSAGFSLRTTDRLQLGLAYDYREASARGSESARELTVFASIRLSERWKLSPYAVRGLTDASADHAFGFSISYRLR